MQRRRSRKIWICGDVWMDIFPLFDRVELGLKMALLSDRFDILVDKHFDGRELTIWREILICKDIGSKPCVSVRIDVKWVDFPLPDHPLPNKIRFKDLRIDYIDHSVIEFVRSNKQIWDRMGTKLELNILNVQPIWDVFIRQILPIFATNIRHLSIAGPIHLDNLHRLISTTILTDLDHLSAINSGLLLLADVIADDGPNSTAGQALSKWLYTSKKDGHIKELRCNGYLGSPSLEWINNFKETFSRATTSSSYIIQLIFYTIPTPTAGPFELVNERTNEKLILWRKSECNWLLKRCPIGETATDQWKDENWDDNLNTVKFYLLRGNDSIGPLSPPAEEEKEEADNESNEN